MATQQTLREQRQDDLEAAARARRTEQTARTSAAEANADKVNAADLAAARATGGQIASNARAANIAAEQASQPQSETAAQIAADNAASDAAAAKSNALQSASQLINAFLQNVPGIAQLDPNNELGNWMNGQTSSLYGSGITDPTAILNTLETTINNPTNDPAAKAVFDRIFPGYNQRIQNGLQNGGGIQSYLQYATQVQQYAQTAGLTNGTVTGQEIGNLWASDVSAAEVSDRITSAYVAATNTPQDVQDYLKTTYNMGPGDITSYYLDPTKTLNTLNAVNAGIAGVETGFGALSQSQAASLSAFLQPSSSSGVTPVAIGDVQNVLNRSLNTVTPSGVSSASAAQLAGLETAGPGQNAGGTVTQNELLSAMGVPGEGSTQQQALTAVSNAQQTRTAGSRGGGGLATNAAGGSGIGFAQE